MNGIDVGKTLIQRFDWITMNGNAKTDHIHRGSGLPFPSHFTRTRLSSAVLVNDAAVGGWCEIEFDTREYGSWAGWPIEIESGCYALLSRTGISQLCLRTYSAYLRCRYARKELIWIVFFLISSQMRRRSRMKVLKILQSFSQGMYKLVSCVTRSTLFPLLLGTFIAFILSLLYCGHCSIAEPGVSIQHVVK